MNSMQSLIKNGRTILTQLSPSLAIVPVRYRKPRDVPKAPSKMYVVREPTERDPVEYETLMREYNHYRTTVKSLHDKLKGAGILTHNRRVEGSTTTPNKTDTDDSLAKGLELNRIWNNEIAAKREERLEREQEASSKMTNAKIRQHVAKFEQTQDDERKLLSKLPYVYLTDLNEEKLDAKLDEILNSPSANYDYPVPTKTKS